MCARAAVACRSCWKCWAAACRSRFLGNKWCPKRRSRSFSLPERGGRPCGLRVGPAPVSGLGKTLGRIRRVPDGHRNIGFARISKTKECSYENGTKRAAGLVSGELPCGEARCGFSCQRINRRIAWDAQRPQIPREVVSIVKHLFAN
jgi:hypothetical protein